MESNEIEEELFFHGFVHTLYSCGDCAESLSIAGFTSEHSRQLTSEVVTLENGDTKREVSHGVQSLLALLDDCSLHETMMEKEVRLMRLYSLCAVCFLHVVTLVPWLEENMVNQH